MGQAIPLPSGVHSVTPNVVVRDAAGAIAFYEKAFGAKEVTRFSKSDGRIWHAELRIGDSVLFLSDELSYSPMRAPGSRALPATEIQIYVDDADAVFARAVEAGARSILPVSDAFWGDRMGIVADPFGHTWAIATHVRDVPAEEIRRLGEKMVVPAASETRGIYGP